MLLTTHRSAVLAPYLGFALFGAFWGTWGAALPAVRSQTGIDDGQLGAALVFVALGALPAMLAAGRVVDRAGQRAAPAFIAALGLVALALSVFARDQLTLSIALTAVGATSGAADVAINASASAAQAATGSPVVSRSHGLFSVAVVASSLGTGGLLALGAPLVVPFAAVTVIALGVALTLRATATPPASSPPPLAVAAAGPGRRWGTVGLGSLVVIGALAALAFATENAHQSWSAIYLGDVLGAGPAIAATGPALFAAVTATVRFTTARLGIAHPAVVVTTGALLAAAGTTVLASATTLTTGLAGLAIAALGTAVLYPTLVSALSAHLPDAARGRAISIVATIAYTGFLAGPIYVGRFAAITGLPTAMIAVAALAAALAAAAPLALRPTLAKRPAPDPIGHDRRSARR